MNELTITFNNQDYTLTYNSQTGYYEIELTAPSTGGIYEVEATFTDLFNKEHENSQTIQILTTQKIELDMTKMFMWIFDYQDFSIKDIVEIADYEISIDEETNANSIIRVLKDTGAKARDLIVVKRNNENVYWGIIEEVSNNDGEQLYEYNLKYITNMFNQDVILENEELLKTTGVEDFIANAITNNFIENEDTFLNKTYLQINVKTHTKKQTTVSNVQDGIYNLHTYMTNCTQNYNIVYSFSISNGKLVITIEVQEIEKELIDVNAQSISNYTEVFETDVVAKVTVLTKEEGKYNLYLLNDRTTTTDMNNENRADGTVETTYTEKMEDANQKALDVMKGNSYNHKITFNLANEYIKIGTPIAIKTRKSVILDTYISAVKFTQANFFEYTCGNIRTNFIDKLKKERNS